MVVTSAGYSCVTLLGCQIITLELLEGFHIYIFVSLQQQLRKLVLEIIHRIPTNEHLRPHTKNVLSVMFRFLEVTFENFYLAAFKTFNDFLTVKSCIIQLFH